MVESGGPLYKSSFIYCTIKTVSPFLHDIEPKMHERMKINLLFTSLTTHTVGKIQFYFTVENCRCIQEYSYIFAKKKSISITY